MELCCPTTKYWTFRAKHFLFHEAHVTAAQYDEESSIVQNMVDGMLKHGKNPFVMLGKVGEFIKDQYQSLIILPLMNVQQGLLP